MTTDKWLKRSPTTETWVNSCRYCHQAVLPFIHVVRVYLCALGLERAYIWTHKQHLLVDYKAKMLTGGRTYRCSEPCVVHHQQHSTYLFSVCVFFPFLWSLWGSLHWGLMTRKPWDQHSAFGVDNWGFHLERGMKFIIFIFSHNNSLKSFRVHIKWPIKSYGEWNEVMQHASSSGLILSDVKYW